MEKTKKYLKDNSLELFIGALGMNLLSTAFAVFVNNNPLILIVTFASIVILLPLVSIVRKQMAQFYLRTAHRR